MYIVLSNIYIEFVITVLFIFQITVSFDETTTLEDVDKLFEVFAGGKPVCKTKLFLK